MGSTLWPSLETLAQKAHLSVRTVWSHLKTLAEKNLVAIRRRGKGQSNYYILPYDISLDKEDNPIPIWDCPEKASPDTQPSSHENIANHVQEKDQSFKYDTRPEKIANKILEEDLYKKNSSSNIPPQKLPSTSEEFSQTYNYTDQEAQEIIGAWIKTFGERPPDAPFYELVLAADWMLYLQARGELNAKSPVRLIYHIAYKDQRLQNREFPRWAERKKQAQERAQRKAQAKAVEAREMETELRWRKLWAEEKSEVKDYYLQRARKDSQIQRLGAGEQVVAYHLWRKEKLEHATAQ